MWKEGQFTVSKAAGIANRRRCAAELWAELEKQAKPGKYGCVQVRELWSTEEEHHLRDQATIGYSNLMMLVMVQVWRKSFPGCLLGHGSNTRA